MHGTGIKRINNSGEPTGLLAVKGGNSRTLLSSAQTDLCFSADDDCSHFPQLSTHVYNYPRNYGNIFLKFGELGKLKSNAVM